MKLKGIVTTSAILFSINVSSQISDYIFPNTYPSFSNYGGLGIIQAPNARFHEEGSLAFSWSHNDPYLRGSIIAYPFNWLEASFQYTDINNALYSNVKSFSGSQSLKDKSFDFKLRLMRETKLFPQIALGVRDLGGTGLFTSEYIVGSKRISNIDFSIGMGWGVLSNSDLKNPLGYINERFYERQSRNLEKTSKGGEANFNTLFTGDTSLFAGLEIFLPKSKGTRFKIEYDTTNYDEEGRKPVFQDSKINYGFVKPITNNLFVKLSYTRGNTLNFGFSYKLHLGSKKHAPKKSEVYSGVENSEVVKKVAAKSNRNLYRLALKELRDRDLVLQFANLDQNEFHVAYAQTKFSNYALASQRVLRVLNDISPNDITKFKVTTVNAEMGLNSMIVNRDFFQRNLNNESPELALRSYKLAPIKLNLDEFEYKPKKSYPKLFYSFEPELKSQIGGPDGFYFGDLRVSFQSELILAPNLSIFANLSQGLTNNYDDLKLPSDSILPHVRTDIVDYLKEGDGLTLDVAQLNYFSNPFKNVYTKVAAGYFESMFGGIGGEVLYRPFYSNFALGAELFYVKQRDFKQDFNFKDYETATGHITLYYTEPNTGIVFKLKGGRYLAKDSGFTFDFSRRFRTGFQVGAFFSRTDISEEEFGEGSFDKGFYFMIPLNMFTSNYTKRNFNWGLRPVTRDGAAILTHSMPLWGVTDQGNFWPIEGGFSDIYD